MFWKKVSKKISILLSTLILGTTILTGCSSNDADSSSKRLVIYSNSTSDGRGDWLKEKAAEAGFKIDIVEGGGGDIENRLVSEKNNPIADVVFGPNTMQFEKFKENDLLEQFVPSWAGEVSEGLNDVDGYYHSIVKQAILLIYNTELYNEETAPKDWTDLWTNKEFKNKYQVEPSLDGGTTRVVLAGILSRYRDDNGELGISKEGWKAVEEYYKNGVARIDGEDFYANLVSGKAPMCQIWSSGIASREKQYGVKAGLVNPEIGVPYVVEQIGIVKGSKNVETAKEFIEWFGTAEIQGEWAQEFDSMPANEKAMDKASEQSKYINENYKAQDLDWTFIAKNMDAWAQKIELEYMK